MIEVQLGDDQYPVINLSGYTYNLDYNTDAVVEGTLGIDFYERGWFANNAATLNMYKFLLGGSFGIWLCPGQRP